jgi:Lar family restriction alleviation protein
MSSMLHLLPCPFCGAEPGIEHDILKTDDARVVCECGAVSPVEDAGAGLSAHSAQRAAKHWNRRAALPATGAVKGRLTDEDVEWVVNDIAELGVKIGDQFFFLYKGRSLVYGALDPDPTQPPTHDEDNEKVGFRAGDPMKWRPVFKREFGECAHPINYADLTRIGTVSYSDSDDWADIPAASPPSPSWGGHSVSSSAQDDSQTLLPGVTETQASGGEPEPDAVARVRAEGVEVGAATIEEIGKMLIEAAQELRSPHPFASPPKPSEAMVGARSVQAALHMLKLIGEEVERHFPDARDAVAKNNIGYYAKTATDALTAALSGGAK